MLAGLSHVCALNRSSVHWQVLVSKKLIPVLHETVNGAARVASNMQMRPLTDKLFSQLVKKIDSKRTAVLFRS